MAEQTTKHKRTRRSIASRTVFSTIAGCITLSILTLIIGLNLYAEALINKYVDNAFDTSRHAATSAKHGVNSIGLANRVMEIYRGLSEDERAMTGTPEYRAKFAEIEESHEYSTLIKMFQTYIHSDNVYDVYLAMYDIDTCTMVYIADPDSEGRLYPGEWEPVTREGMMKFLEWDGNGVLYDIDNTKKYGWLCTAGQPITDEDGNICAFVLTDIAPSNFMGNIMRFAVSTFAGTILITILIVCFQLHYMKKTVVKPVKNISQAAWNYVRDKKSGANVTDHFSALKTNTGNEIDELTDVMSEMERDLIEHENEITRITAEKEHIIAELDLARKIQADMLPNSFPAFPDRPEFDIYATMTPAKAVGGDFYDFFLIDDDHLALVIADVSGKGIPAALFMMISKMLINNYAEHIYSPAKILEKMNNVICRKNKEEMFVTVWLGVLEISTGKITSANAGHEFPVIGRADGDFEYLNDKHGFVIGIMDGMTYKEYEIQLRKGDTLFLYTDGLPEAADSDEELFGTERVLDVLNRNKGRGPAELLNAVQAEVDSFVGSADQFDDLTMFALKIMQ